MPTGDCPAPLRGYRYSTHLTLRCLNYHACPLCSMCRKYDRHDSNCVNCESRKLDGTKCTCSEGQLLVQQEMERRTKQPLFSSEGIDPGQKFLDLAETSEGRDLDRMIQEEFLGIGGPKVEHFHHNTTETVGDVLRKNG